MEVNPQNFEVSESVLRLRLHLSPHAMVFPFGYEGLVDQSLILMLKQRYDVASLYFRTRPDYMVNDGPDLYLVEAKNRSNYVEAVQLFFNRCLERMGIKILYSFPEITIHALSIPLETVVIPEDYKEKFDANLKHLFASEGVRDYRYVGPSKKGEASGDPFVPIEVDDLTMFSEEEFV